MKNKYTVSDFKREMKGIYSSCIGADTLDEAPFAYCSIKEIAEQTNAAWREHTRIVRGNPVRVYEGEKFILKKSLQQLM